MGWIRMLSRLPGGGTSFSSASPFTKPPRRLRERGLVLPTTYLGAILAGDAYDTCYTLLTR
jgi:hypothetical protein